MYCKQSCPQIRLSANQDARELLLPSPDRSHNQGVAPNPTAQDNTTTEPPGTRNSDEEEDEEEDDTYVSPEGQGCFSFRQSLTYAARTTDIPSASLNSAHCAGLPTTGPLPPLVLTASYHKAPFEPFALINCPTTSEWSTVSLLVSLFACTKLNLLSFPVRALLRFFWLLFVVVWFRVACCFPTSQEIHLKTA